MHDLTGQLPLVPKGGARCSPLGESETIVLVWNDFRAVILQQPREQCQAGLV